MAAKKGESIHKESDRLSAAGTAAVYRVDKMQKAVKAEMQKEGVKEAVMAYIFSGDPEAISPLQEVRDTNK